MKTILLSLLRFSVFILLATLPMFADGSQCRHGLSWTISQNRAWGYGQPVITNIKPHSAASAAGLRNHDIIEEIDGFATKHLSPQQIVRLLAEGDKLHTLKTSNIGYTNKRHILALQCKPCNSLTERELAELFSLYSIEDANLQRILYPYTYTQSSSYPLLSTKTYTFAPSTAETASTDLRINKQIEELLRKKGFETNEHADLVLSSYYHIENLPSEQAGRDEEGGEFAWRYNTNTRSLLPLPVLNPKQTQLASAKYKLVFGVVMQSRRSREIVWSCEATEYLTEALSVSDYAESAIGTMLLAFPFVKEKTAPLLSAHTLCYNYTGILLSQNSLNTIVGIEDLSPAMKAGLRPGDVILSINGQKLTTSNGNLLLEKYLKHAESMARYRDKDLPPLQALVADIPVSYWGIDSYETIARQLERANNEAVFSYLFAFRPYILGKEGKLIIFEVQRNGQQFFVPIAPEYRNETTISPL